MNALLVPPCPGGPYRKAYMANRLREFRRYHGHTLRSLAAQCGTSKSTLHRVECLGFKPGQDRDTAVRIAAFFGHAVEDIFPETAALPQFRHPDLPAAQHAVVRPDPWARARAMRAREREAAAA
jgi:DNA-binding XRE family transcriptional regulator